MRARVASDTHRRVRRARSWIAVAGVLIGCAFGMLALLHVAGGLNPVTDALSLFAFTGDTGWLLQLSAICLAVGSLTTLGALGAAGLPSGGAVGAFLISWAGGLTLTAVFRASVALHAAPVEGVIHRWTAAIAFLSLPGAGFALAAKLRKVSELSTSRTVLFRTSVLAAGSLVVFGIVYLLPDSLTWAPVGLTQRITLLGYVLVLVAMLRAASRAERP